MPVVFQLVTSFVQEVPSLEQALELMNSRLLLVSQQTSYLASEQFMTKLKPKPGKLLFCN